MALDPAETAARWQTLQDQIAAACARAQRDPATVRLMAVSKRQSLASIRAAYAAGQRDFGENYAQELRDKAEALADLSAIRWHFIGHLQRNKARMVVGYAHTIHTVDSLRLAQQLARVSEQPIAAFVQVNLAGEATKSGCHPEKLQALLGELRPLIDVRGLMAIPPASPKPEDSRPWFRELRHLARVHALEGLSMGMSADFEVAVEEGATVVRVGTALFGPRSLA